MQIFQKNLQVQFEIDVTKRIKTNDKEAMHLLTYEYKSPQSVIKHILLSAPLLTC